MNEKHVTSLELSKKLKAAGCPQVSEFYWRDNELKQFASFAYPPSGKEIYFTDETWSNGSDYCSAYLASELGEMLKDCKMDLPWPVEGGWWWSTMEEDSMETTEAEARGQMLLHLIEHNLIKFKNN